MNFFIVRMIGREEQLSEKDIIFQNRGKCSTVDLRTIRLLFHSTDEDSDAAEQLPEMKHPAEQLTWYAGTVAS